MGAEQTRMYEQRSYNTQRGRKGNANARRSSSVNVDRNVKEFSRFWGGVGAMHTASSSTQRAVRARRRTSGGEHFGRRRKSSASSLQSYSSCSAAPGCSSAREPTSLTEHTLMHRKKASQSTPPQPSAEDLSDEERLYDELASAAQLAQRATPSMLYGQQQQQPTMLQRNGHGSNGHSATASAIAHAAAPAYNALLHQQHKNWSHGQMDQYQAHPGAAGAAQPGLTSWALHQQSHVLHQQQQQLTSMRARTCSFGESSNSYAPYKSYATPPHATPMNTPIMLARNGHHPPPPPPLNSLLEQPAPPSLGGGAFLPVRYT